MICLHFTRSPFPLGSLQVYCPSPHSQVPLQPVDPLHMLRRKMREKPPVQIFSPCAFWPWANDISFPSHNFLLLQNEGWSTGFCEGCMEWQVWWWHMSIERTIARGCRRQLVLVPLALCEVLKAIAPRSHMERKLSHWFSQYIESSRNWTGQLIVNSKTFDQHFLPCSRRMWINAQH